MSAQHEGHREWFPGESKHDVQRFWSVCEPYLVPMLGSLPEWTLDGAPTPIGDVSPPINVAQCLLAEMGRNGSGDFGSYQTALCRIGTNWARNHVDVQLWHGALHTCRQQMVHALLGAYSCDLAKLESSLDAMQSFVDRSTQAISGEYLRECERSRAQQASVNEAAKLRSSRDAQSERKRLERSHHRSQELEMQNASLGEASRLKSEFLANMSHELRTPLNSVIGFAELLCDDKVAVDSPHHHEFLGYILSSGRHLLQLINEVLDLAKVESGTMDFRPEPLDLTQMFAEVCEVVGTQSAAKHVRLVCSIDPLVNQLTLDPARLRQVLYNYVSNAIKFSNDGATVQIHARAVTPGMVRLEVIDTGVGISASNLGRLFVEFQQLDDGPGKSHPGTGLGLALTKRLVEAQGGTVGVASELGKGALFFAELPCHLTVSSHSSRPPPAPRPAGRSVLVVDNDDSQRQGVVQILEAAGSQVRTTASSEEAGTLATNEPELLASLTQAGVLPRRNGVVLVVDDDLASRKLMATTLALLGYQAVCSEDCSDALLLAEQTRPLAVILDLMMPTLDGLTFLSRLRSLPHGRHLPAIIWTSKDLSAVEQRRLMTLAQGVFRKGEGRPKALLDTLQSLVGSGRRLKQRKRDTHRQRDARPRH